MSTETGIYGLIKIGQRLHMEDLIDNGVLFWRRLKACRSIENQARSDILELLMDGFAPEEAFAQASSGAI